MEVYDDPTEPIRNVLYYFSCQPNVAAPAAVERFKILKYQRNLESSFESPSKPRRKPKQSVADHYSKNDHRSEIQEEEYMRTNENTEDHETPDNHREGYDEVHDHRERHDREDYARENYEEIDYRQERREREDYHRESSRRSEHHSEDYHMKDRYRDDYERTDQCSTYQQPRYQYARDPSPEPPKPRARPPSSSVRDRHPRAQMNGNANRALSSRWLNATTPLQLS